MDVAKPAPATRASDIGFAAAIALMLAVLFLPVPAMLVDMGLALSISLSILILMVALWIERPLDFSAFPLVLLIVTMLRLALNVATTRLILSHGHEGPHSAGNMVGGFSQLVMGGDFVIGVIVFVILLTVNFVVITKGATRIAEVGARFTLDAVPGKQMAIDADLSAGLIDEKEARQRRLELEQESSFYGSMDGASKFVRGDAIAGLIITFVNCFGGIIIGVVRHGQDFGTAADVFVKLSVGDGLVTQIPALIVSLAAGILVSKGGNRGTVEKAIVSQLGGQPRALMLAGAMLGLLAIMPGLPFFPFALLASLMFGASVAVTRLSKRTRADQEQKAAAELQAKTDAEPKAANNLIRTSEIELMLGRQLTGAFMPIHTELAHRMAKIRRKFAQQYGFVIPEIRLSDDINLAPRGYCVKVHGTPVANFELRPGEVLVIAGGRPAPDVPHDFAKEPAFGLDAFWVPEMFSEELRNAGYNPFDSASVMLTHLAEVIRNNLSQLLSYRDLRAITDTLEPEYKRLLDEITPSLFSFSSLQAVLRMLLQERVSIRNLHLILEAIAEIAPHSRKPETVVEHVRMRMSQQICGDLSNNGALNVLRAGSRWDASFLQALKRDPKGEVVEFDIEPRALEQFADEATRKIKPLLEKGTGFAIATTPEARPYVRMILDRLFPNLPVLSHVEVAKAVRLEILGSLS